MNELPTWVWYVVIPVIAIWLMSSFRRRSQDWYAMELNMRGIDLYKRGLREEAQRVFEDAVETYPNIAFLRVSLSKMLMDQGRYSQAEDQLRKALQIASEPVTQRDALVNLAGIQYAQKHFTEAVELLEQAIEKHAPDLKNTVADQYKNALQAMYT